MDKQMTLIDQESDLKDDTFIDLLMEELDQVYGENVDRLVCNPCHAIFFCEHIRKKTGCSHDDFKILWTMMKRRKNP